MSHRCLVFSLALLTAALPVMAADQPPGEKASTTTEGLKAGAAVLQSHAPVKQLDVYLVGFHPMKDDPSHQMEAHHYCKQVNEDFAQCVLFDGNSASANMNGIEYIISERLFETLPVEERPYWHPHNYEILSGQLVAPGIPNAAEHKLMDGKMNSYGKTWHVWMTGPQGGGGDTLPLGEPHLAWSFNHDGEDQPGLVEARDKALGLSTAEEKKNRQDLVAKAKPQCGVDALQGRCSRSTTPIAGVTARTENCPKGGEPTKGPR